MVSTPQERKKQSILDLSPIPGHGHPSSQKGKHCGQRTKRSSTSMCSPFAREVSSTSSKGITQLSTVDILFQAPSDIKWTTYNRSHVSNYTKVHYDTVSDIMVMLVNSAPNTYVRVTHKQYTMDMLDLLKAAAARHYDHLAAAPHSTLKGLGPEINPDHPPKNYKDAVSRKDHEKWEEAMMKEYCGFQDMKALAIVKPPKGARLHDTLTR